MEELVNSNSIVCLIETPKEIRNVKFSSKINIVENMRELNDKEGGGLMVLFQDNKGVSFTKIKTNWNLYMIVVYFSVSDKERNINMRKEIEKIVDNSEQPIIIVGGL